MGSCYRCGMKGHIEYGGDGHAYCSSCIFYGLNKPCFRCRMYVPASELQQYKGQWMCPYCIMDARDADRRLNQPKPFKYKKDYPLQVHSYSERCDRCGRELTTVYILNNRKLCSSCVRAEQDKWDTVGGEKPPSTPIKFTLERRKKSILSRLFEKMFSEFLGVLGIRRKPDISPLAAPIDKRYKMFGRPLVSGRKRELNQKSDIPRSEGLMSSSIKTSKEKNKKKKPKKLGIVRLKKKQKKKNKEKPEIVPIKNKKQKKKQDNSEKKED